MTKKGNRSAFPRRSLPQAGESLGDQALRSSLRPGSGLRDDRRRAQESARHRRPRRSSAAVASAIPVTLVPGSGIAAVKMPLKPSVNFSAKCARDSVVQMMRTRRRRARRESAHDGQLRSG